MKIDKPTRAEEILEAKGFRIMCHQKDQDYFSKIFIKPVLEAMEQYRTEGLRDELIAFRRFYFDPHSYCGNMSTDEIVDNYLKQKGLPL